jgi:hypothetical protein
MTKITWEDQYGKYEITTIEEDLDIDQALELVHKLLHAAGYTWLKEGELVYDPQEEKE